MRVRIELLEVVCRDTEDVTGADTFYLVGGASDGKKVQSTLTNRVWINNKQTRAFAPDRSVLFDADVPVGGMVHLALQAYDEDAAKDWAKHGEWITQLADAIAGEIEQLPRTSSVTTNSTQTISGSASTAVLSGPDTQQIDPAQVAAAILRGTVRVVGFFASRDQDDFLGTLTTDIGVGIPGTEIREARINGKRYGGLLGWSTWDYTVRYRITQFGEGLPITAVAYGTRIKLHHADTLRALHSHPHNYGHPGSSGQQQVTAYEGADDNDLWVIKGPHGQPDNYRVGQPVQNGDVIRLEHVATRRNLHSHGGIPSPLTRQQEVTGYGDNGWGDDNDNWRVELEAGGSWATGKRLRLIHTNTNCALHSHLGFAHPTWTMNQQEVTAFDGRDDNDWWSVFEVY